jgi:menaquinone-dependent protoporphyrinogen oxidase
VARVLVLFATVEGQTEKIAGRIAETLSRKGHEARCLRFSEDIQLDDGAILIGASVHYGSHPGALLRWVRANKDLLQRQPSAFFSVSLSARHKPSTARKYVEKFLRKARWRPARSAFFAGAAQYRRYPAWKRLLVLGFVAMAGGDTDTSRDHEYTDWGEVDAFAEGFSVLLT